MITLKTERTDHVDTGFRYTITHRGQETLVTTDVVEVLRVLHSFGLDRPVDLLDQARAEGRVAVHEDGPGSREPRQPVQRNADLKSENVGMDELDAQFGEVLTHVRATSGQR